MSATDDCGGRERLLLDVVELKLLENNYENDLWTFI